MSAGDAGRLFVYGTLMQDAVRAAVCGRALPARAATLAGYARYALRGEVYPAIVPRPRATTDGLLCEGVDHALWQHLDAWESPLYERLTVNVVSGDTLLAAQAYVLTPREHHRLEDRSWSPRDFERLHLAAYLARWGAAP